MKLLSVGNPKTLKGMKQGFNTYIMHLAPADVSGYQTCPKATVGCKAACLNTAGRGGMFKKGETTNTIQKTSIRKTKMFFENRQEFMADLVKDIELAIKQSIKKDLIPVIRLNGTSDLSFEKYEVIRNGVLYRNIFAAFSDIQFYDYTKVLGRKVKDIQNYQLTFSAADGNDRDVESAMYNGMNVAVVFGIKKTLPMPEYYNGVQVFNGDESDLRFLDPKNVVIGLYAKGKAKKDETGFVKYPSIMLKLAANMKFTNYRDKDLFNTRHGGCFDRGSADSYYNRPIEPHYYVGGTAVSEKVTKLTEKEVADYMAGYAFNEQFGDKKSWD